MRNTRSLVALKRFMAEHRNKPFTLDDMAMVVYPISKDPIRALRVILHRFEKEKGIRVVGLPKMYKIVGGKNDDTDPDT